MFDAPHIKYFAREPIDDGAKIRELSKLGTFSRAYGVGEFKRPDEARPYEWGCTINTLDVDSYGTVIHPRGVITHRFERNPVVYRDHGWIYNEMPIGRCVSLSIQDDKIDATFVLAEGVEPADSVRKLLEQEIIRGVSVTFLPIEMESDKDDDGNDIVHIRRWELVEFSVVGINSNPATLMHTGTGKTNDARARIVSYPDKQAEARSHAASLLALAMADGANLAQIQVDSEKALAVYGTTFEEIVQHRRSHRVLDLVLTGCSASDPVSVLMRGAIVDAWETVNKDEDTSC